jgi:hypothetical protein
MPSSRYHHDSNHYRRAATTFCPVQLPNQFHHFAGSWHHSRMQLGQDAPFCGPFSAITRSGQASSIHTPPKGRSHSTITFECTFFAFRNGFVCGRFRTHIAGQYLAGPDSHALCVHVSQRLKIGMFLNEKHNAGTGIKARVHVSRGPKITTCPDCRPQCACSASE